jgi:hypothetical protein
MIKPTIPKQKGIIMWKNRSPVLSACLDDYEDQAHYLQRTTDIKTDLAFMKATMVANPHGGAQSRSVIVREYPSVAVRAAE